jgi:VWFA-related protein
MPGPYILQPFPRFKRFNPYEITLGRGCARLPAGAHGPDHVPHGREAHQRVGFRALARVAQDTGGVDFDARKTDMATQFKLIGEQLRSSYELAYQSTNPASDGTFRKISVQVKRPGVTVRAKTGYYAR